MLVEINADERKLLVALLDREISNLGPEIHHTMTSDLRDALKVDKKILLDLLERLSTTSGQ